MSPYTPIAAVLVVAFTAWFSYSKGQQNMKNEMKARESDAVKLIEKVRDDARLGAAEAIATIAVQHVTIQGKVEREIQTNTVYRDCVHSDASLRDINEALRNGSQDVAGGGLKLPHADGIAGPVVRSDNEKAPAGR